MDRFYKSEFKNNIWVKFSRIVVWFHFICCLRFVFSSRYVQIKKVAGGVKRECQIVAGVVCSKNLPRKTMPTRLVDPQILLLSSAVMYQRVEGKYLSLEPVIMQVWNIHIPPVTIHILFCTNINICRNKIT